MNQRNLNKILATMLIITLTFANILLLGDYASDTYASSENLEKQDMQTNNSNVEFDVYYLNSDGTKTHEIKQDISSTSITMYAYVKVQKGYLKDAKIKIYGENESQKANIEILNSDEPLELIENIDKENSLVELKQVDKNTEIVLQIPVKANQDNLYDLQNISKLNTAKLMATYVNDDGKEKKIQSEIKQRVEWEGTVNVNVSQEVTKYIPYNVEGKTGIIIETLIKTGLENNALPVQETNIEVKVPTFANLKPKKVIVTAKSTRATNGKDGIYFGENNWSYNEETSKININVKNEPNNNIVSWEKNCEDEYLVIYIYDEEAYNLANEEQIINMQTSAKIKAYNNTIVEASKEIANAVNLQEAKGEVVSQDLLISTNQMSKGSLYTKTNNNAQYKVTSVSTISNIDLVDSIVQMNYADSFIGADTSKYNAISNYNSTSISKENFMKILGQDGEIRILDANNNELVKINKDYTEDENGNYTYKYEGIETNYISIVTTKPIQEGRLVLEHIKTLQGDTQYNKNEIADFEKLQINVEQAVVLAEGVLSRQAKTQEITLVEPSTKVELQSNYEELSTIVENENVEIRAILKTDAIDCDLYKNPTVKIILPNYISKMQINSINLAFDNELKIANYSAQRNSNGEVEILVQLEGEDTIYNTDTVSKGANIIINANITLKDLTPTTEAKAKVFVNNENVTRYENEVSNSAYAETTLNAVAPVGLVTTNAITDYNQANETVLSVSGQEKVGKLDYKSEAQRAIAKMNIINNYENNLKDISILGRVPFVGNKSVETNQDLGTTLEAKISELISMKGLSQENVTVYYSNNENATKDLNAPENNWQTNMNIEDVKSYLIVLNNYEMETGEIIEFDYAIDIPGNLNYNQTIASNYAVYYTQNIGNARTTNETAIAPITTVTTGEGLELEAQLSSNLGDATEVEEGEVITFEVTVKNNGKQTAENITVKSQIPGNTVYTEYITDDEYSEDGYVDNYDLKEFVKTIEKIEPNETATVKYSVRVLSIDKDADITIENNATIQAEKLQQNMETNILKYKIITGTLNVHMTTYPDMENGLIREGQNITYTAQIKNPSTFSKTNIQASIKIPDGTTYVESYILTNEKSTEGVSYNESTRTATYNIGELEGQKNIRVVVVVTANEITDGSLEREFKASTQVKCAESSKTITSNEVYNRIALASLQTSFSNSIGTVTMTDEDSIEYYITIKNNGKVLAKNVEIVDYLPKELNYEYTRYTLDGKEIENKNGSDTIRLTIDIPEGETLRITIRAKANRLTDAETKEIENKINVSCKNIGYEITETIKNTIKASNPETVEPNGTTQERYYNISGTAWFDRNKNGIKESTESVMTGIEVMLMNADNGATIKDANGQNLRIKTDEKGSYVFENMKRGNYIVVFLYDSNMYDVTTYRATNVPEEQNSDAITMNIKVDDNIVKGAISDKLQISNANIYNIDIGLFENLKFDLKLDKAITKITISNSKETKTYNYNYSKVAKLDLKAKEAKGTNVIIEYKITVTNEGALPGYAKRIVDYIPSDMKFSSELNQNWYVGEDGNLYNSELANTLLQPGESKELTLILTKVMTDDNLGIINNNAEIFESYNDQGKEDTDSIVANRIKDEDDLSYADAVIETKTGEVYIYSFITLISIIIFGLGIYYINKKVLRRIM